MKVAAIPLIEREILLQVAQGYPTRDILERHSLTHREYRHTVSDLKRRFRARSLQEAVVLAYESGFIRI